MIKRSQVQRSSDDHVHASVYDPDFLLQKARWIRDELDPQVARDGPDALHSDNILTLDELLRRLLISRIVLEDIRFSRLHLAIISMSGRATRWPKKLIDRAESKLGSPLYEPGGRLHGICKPEDFSREKILIKWLKTPGVKLSPLLARRVGDLGFKPGDWWISALFAFKDGIIDSADPSGGVIADANGAYAILMTKDEEVNGPSFDSFTYRARDNDRGRYRLTSATRESRQPIRVLRSHSLKSFWSPRAGVRYDGLHVVTGWSIVKTPNSKAMVYEITFKRLPSKPSQDVILRRPFSDEVEDYKEYNFIREAVRAQQEEAARARKVVSPPTIIAPDGTVEFSDDEASDTSAPSIGKDSVLRDDVLDM
ncbi:hypothetical protein LTR37_000433 [Vermiconidia calcicola]|uniref:Uncharacterized protein n=1 Tax=Vermiconidia calcicola TaxID=1690605 RepID=A0ACC3NYZ3_9PEZI|nr:hypothetical protein LTR37_000433 [Vermiconidia calcicola]